MHPFYEIRKRDFSVKNNKYEVVFSPHIHSDIEILYMRSGTQHITIGEKSYEVKAGEAAVIFPNMIHSYFKQPQQSEIDAILIICSKRFYTNFFPDMTDSVPENPILSAESVHEDAAYAFQKISGALPINLQIAWTIVIMQRLLEYMSLSASHSRPVEDIGFKIVKYVEEHFTEPLTLDSIASELSVSKSYVSRVFSKSLNINFRKYLGLLRAEYASTLIRTTNEKFTVIAEMSGFESLSTFNRIFKEIYGMPPKEFKNNLNAYRGQQIPG